MREDRKRHEPPSGVRPEYPSTDADMISWMDGYDQGYEAGVEEAREQFMQAQMLLMYTAGNA